MFAKIIPLPTNSFPLRNLDFLCCPLVPREIDFWPVICLPSKTPVMKGGKGACYDLKMYCFKVTMAILLPFSTLTCIFSKV